MAYAAAMPKNAGSMPIEGSSTNTATGAPHMAPSVLASTSEAAVLVSAAMP